MSTGRFRWPDASCDPSGVPSLDDDIDALYQLAPGDFTAARNSLAKRAGGRAEEIRRCAKPNAAAWAVNQVYWHDRPTFEALAKASATRRAAHVRQLRGEGTDHSVADARHQAALDLAMDAATRFLHSIGDAVAPATLDAVSRTLEAVPSDEIQGRLTRPVDPVGFSMLASLMGPTGLKTTRSPAEVVPMPRRPNGRIGGAGEDGRGGTRNDVSRAQQARQRERARLQRELTAARAREKKAAEMLTAARRALARGNARVDQLEQDLAEARRLVTGHHQATDEARLAQNDAAAARALIERQLREMDA